MKKVVTWNSPAHAPVPKPQGRVRITNNDGIISTLIDHLRPGRLFALAFKLRSFNIPTDRYPVLTKSRSLIGGSAPLREGTALKRGTFAIYAGETRVTTEMKGRQVKAMAYLFVVGPGIYAITDLSYVKPVDGSAAEWATDTTMDQDD